MCSPFMVDDALAVVDVGIGLLDVMGFEVVRPGDEWPVLGADRRGLVVIDRIANVAHARLSEEIECFQRLSQPGASQPTWCLPVNF